MKCKLFSLGTACTLLLTVSLLAAPGHSDQQMIAADIADHQIETNAPESMRFGSGDVTIHLNGGDDVAYIGETNTIEIWIRNDAKLTGLSLGFEFSIGRGYRFDSTYGALGYVNPEGDAVGAFDMIHMEMDSIDNVSPDSILIYGVAMMAGLPPHATHSLCYTMQVYIHPCQPELAGGFCIDNILMYLNGIWAFADGSGTYPPDFQDEPNSSPYDPDAPPICFDIVTGLLSDWYCKPGYVDYCPNGMPDFNQFQDFTQPPDGVVETTYCGPVAVANCFWWFDSKYEPYPMTPPALSDYYPLVTAYGAWDDHFSANVRPLVEELADSLKTDIGGIGTHINNMHQGIRNWLASIAYDYNVNLYACPISWDFLAGEVKRSQDVILLLGFYLAINNDPLNCCRLSGHYVTVAGVDSANWQIVISDPALDAANPEPPSHNDAFYVSHDMYNVGIGPLCDTVANCLYLTDYPADPLARYLYQQNGDSECPNPDDPGTIYTVIEYAEIICPGPGPRDTVECEPQGGSNPSHPPTYWYDVTPVDFGRCDFQVQVFDSVETNYTNWVEPSTKWTHQVHKVGGKWWVSWWNPGCDSAIFTPFRFQFDNPSPPTWGDWRTTVSGTNNPYLQVVDSSANHDSEPDGFGYRVHVPGQSQCGDADGSGSVNVSDAVYITNCIFVPDSPCPGNDRGDCNCDGRVNISDVVWIINYIFAGGYAPCDIDGDTVPDC